MLLEMRDVTKTYDMPDSREHVSVLRGVSLRILAGETLAVVGPSGTGKSTLLNLMGALDRPTSGTVRFQGREMAGLSDRELSVMRCREIGFVFQLHHLLSQCTVLENVLVPTLAAAAAAVSDGGRERAMRLLERVGLRERADFFPSRLSGGERQRVAVARALINRPSLILADEPTGSLDRHTAGDMGRLLADLHAEENAALVVVTHSEELAALMGRQYKLAEGRLVGE